MSKKTNTYLFLFGATIFNIVVTVLIFVLLLVAYGRLIAPLLPEQVAAYGLPVIFIGAIALAFVVYRYAMKLFLKRVDADKTFDPIFKPRRPRPRD